MSSKGNKRERVRFAEGTVEHTRKALPGEEPPSVQRRPKRPRPERPNADELDDIDDYNANEDEEEALPKDIPNEHELLEAKRERRMRQRDAADEDGDTKIDNRTSLEAEGIEVEPFNMEQEKSDGTGYFDGDTYVFRKRDGDEEPDAWLESLSEVKEDYAVTAKQEQDEPENAMDSWSELELYAKILPLVSDTETVMQAIARYGNLIKRHRHPPKQHRTDSEKTSSASFNMAQEALNELTEAANALLLKGRVDIYQQTRNDLLKLLPDEPTAAQPEQKPVVQWEYQGNQDGQVHGPYTTQQMKGWIQQGYFVGPTAVKVRSISERTREKTMQEDLLSDLMDNDENGNEKTEQVRGDWSQSDQVDFTKYS